jgi:hypothetical protein
MNRQTSGKGEAGGNDLGDRDGNAGGGQGPARRPLER